MALPNSYVQTGRLGEYFQAMLKANPPDRFTQRFLETLGFSGKNDRAFIGLLKELEFIDNEGKPLSRYFAFLDESNWKVVLAEAIRNAYSDLFAVNNRANELSADEVKNKLRTLYYGQKTDTVIRLIAKTFEDLVELADFSSTESSIGNNQVVPSTFSNTASQHADPSGGTIPLGQQKLSIRALEYHINIVLPETRDQAVYDAIFRSLRDHLG